ncbi:MAG: NADH-quinone oxidoreductase subunit I [bacterium]|nr:NADH-quinone oxidoreductase subunit I [Candidatus Sumerlaeota bacterium]
MPSSNNATSPVAEYFGMVWNAVITTLIGLGVTGWYMFTKPVTLQYPDEKPEIPDGYRGIHIYEKEKCIACDLCSAACPVDCIKIESAGKGKNAVITRYEIDYNRCLFCGLCVEPCPSNCIHMGKSYDLAAYRSQDCAIDFVKLWEERKLQSPSGDVIEWPDTPNPAAPGPLSPQRAHGR